MFSCQLFHLDLKGAPPKVNYIEELFAFVSRLGITGVLIEYEDTFPFAHSLSPITAIHAYSKQDIQRIIASARDNRLKLIPLVQTFGHLEYVLKHSSWSHLREVSKYPNAICPSNPDSFSLVTSMIAQMVELHQLSGGQLDAIHIGADEVWLLACCPACQQVCQSSGWNRDHLFLDYVTRIVKYVKDTFPHLQVIMWDDMLRNIPIQVIIDSRLNQCVTPMIWHYLDEREFGLNDSSFWGNFCQLFDHMWIASAFKGASKIKQMIPPIEHHVSNQLAWIEIVRKFGLQNKLQGIALTGWQRFDHFTTLCEILPASIPSLVICVAVLAEGKFDENVLQKASNYLSSERKLFPLSPLSCPLDSLTFPGANIYLLCCKLSILRNNVLQLICHPSLEGGFSKYLISQNRVNPLHIESFIVNARELSTRSEEMKFLLEKELENVFDAKTIEEWMEENVCSLVRKLSKIVKNGENQLSQTIHQ